VVGAGSAVGTGRGWGRLGSGSGTGHDGEPKEGFKYHNGFGGD